MRLIDSVSCLLGNIDLDQVCVPKLSDNSERWKLISTTGVARWQMGL